MPFPVKYSPEYDRVRARLSLAERMLVGEAEDKIAANPDTKPDGRFEDDGYAYSSEAEDFLIEYRLLSSGWILFERLIDLRNPEL